eukprot:TRINITY_DN1963_c0_g1_i2.p1 TRINITY_DN1963_c0_g1~~TRINITY_DN1963_c0_g1_i2.p1  ORF type:complete len:786 (-),score=145.67 TRINITY_DN1963_c0_g1_i2:73-2430(-)
MGLEYIIGCGWLLYGGGLGCFMFRRARAYERSRHTLELEVLNGELERDQSKPESAEEEPSLLTVLGVVDLGLLNDLLGVENRTRADFERRRAEATPLELPLQSQDQLSRQRYPTNLKVLTYGIMVCDFIALSSFVFAVDVIGDCTVARALGAMTLSRQELGTQEQYIAVWVLVLYFLLLCIAIVTCGMRKLTVLLALVEVLVVPLCNACFSLMAAPITHAHAWESHWVGTGPGYVTLASAVVLVLLAYPTAVSCSMNSIFWGCRGVSLLPTFGVSRVGLKYLLCAVNSWGQSAYAIVAVQLLSVTGLLLANLKLMPWLGRWVRANHVYSAMLTSCLLCSIAITVFKFVESFLPTKESPNTVALVILFGSLPCGLASYYRYCNRVPYSKLSEAVIYRMNTKTLERDLPELLDSIAQHTLACNKPHYARQGLLKLCLGWTRDDVRVLAARAIAVVARCSMLSNELLTALSRARRDPSDAVSAAVRMTLIDLRQLQLLRLTKDLGPSSTALDRARACDTVARLVSLFHLNISQGAFEPTTPELLLGCMSAPEEEVQRAGFRGCSAVCEASMDCLLAPILATLRTRSTSLGQHAALSVLAVTVKHPLLALKANSHLEIGWDLLEHGPAQVSQAAGRVFETLQQQPHFMHTLQKHATLLQQICISLEHGSASASYSTATQMAIGLAHLGAGLLSPWVTARLAKLVLQPEALDSQLLALVAALEATATGRLLLEQSAVIPAVLDAIMLPNPSNPTVHSAVLVAARLFGSCWWCSENRPDPALSGVYGSGRG